MSQTYVTFLGRGREDTGTGYRTTTYQFPDGSEKTTAFFGLALAEYIHPKPDRIVILGTRGSQWGVLVENLAKTDEDEEARLQLLDAETSQTVSQDMLNRVAKLMCEAVDGPVVPRLIPFGQDEGEQYEILEIIDEEVKDGTVSLDLTHGFRHFGMIGFLSAFMLERIRELKVSDLWYGALDMTQDGITPVLKLDGLDRVQRWLNALNRFDATGDYSEFVQLLTEDGVSRKKAQCLKDAAFHERTLNLSASTQKISTFLPELKKPLTGASGLFQERLSERLAWAKSELLSEKQGKLARQYLARRDYMRAALFGWEALVTWACELEGVDPQDRSNREQQDVGKALQSQFKGQAEIRKAGENLNQIRNPLAHGTSPKCQQKRRRKDCQRQGKSSCSWCSACIARRMIENEECLGNGLDEIFETLKVGQ